MAKIRASLERCEVWPERADDAWSPLQNDKRAGQTGRPVQQAGTHVPSPRLQKAARF